MMLSESYLLLHTVVPGKLHLEYSLALAGDIGPTLLNPEAQGDPLGWGSLSC